MATLLVTSISTTNAQVINIDNPRFYNDVNGPAARQIFNVSFGWFKTLDDEQKSAYYSTIAIALDEVQPGQFVRWYKNDASGFVRVAWQIPRDGSVCKRLHLETIAHGVRKNTQATACFNEVDNTWTWYN